MNSLHSFSSIKRREIDKLYNELNNELSKAGVNEELFVHGGAVMCDLGARESTMDIDAVYSNVQLMKSITKKIATKYGKDFDFVNNDIKPFLSDYGTYRLYKSLSNLKIFYAEQDYLFALKCKSCRTDSNDIKDLIFLVKELNVSSIERAEEIISSYFDLSEVSILYKDILEDNWSGVADLLYWGDKYAKDFYV